MCSKQDMLVQKAGPVKSAFLTLIPMLFDLTATALMSIGLLYVTVSVYQMLRGTEMVFAAIYGVLFLRRKLNTWHIVGLVGALVSLEGLAWFGVVWCGVACC